MAHVEATSHIHRVVQMIKAAGVKPGVVLNPGTPVESIKYVLGDVDQILVMTVNPGFGGQSFIESQVEKIAELDRLRKEHGYHYEIEVDGGIQRPKNVPQQVQMSLSRVHIFMTQRIHKKKSMPYGQRSINECFTCCRR